MRPAGRTLKLKVFTSILVPTPTCCRQVTIVYLAGWNLMGFVLVEATAHFYFSHVTATRLWFTSLSYSLYSESELKDLNMLDPGRPAVDVTFLYEYDAYCSFLFGQSSWFIADTCTPRHPLSETSRFSSSPSDWPLHLWSRFAAGSNDWVGVHNNRSTQTWTELQQSIFHHAAWICANVESVER